MKILIVKRRGFASSLKRKLINKGLAGNIIIAVETIEEAEKHLAKEQIDQLIIGLNLKPDTGDLLLGWRWACNHVIPKYPHLAHRIIIFSSHIDVLNKVGHDQVEDADIVCAPGPSIQTYRDALQKKNTLKKLVERIVEVSKTS